MASWEDVINVVVDEIKEEGISVRVASDITPEIEVYNSAKPQKQSTGLPFVTPNFAVVVRDKNGNIITQYNESPGFNIIKAGLFYGFFGLGFVTLIKGIKGFLQ